MIGQVEWRDAEVVEERPLAMPSCLEISQRHGQRDDLDKARRGKVPRVHVREEKSDRSAAPE